MSISRMLMPVGLEARDERLLTFGCGLHVQGVQHLLAAHVVDSSGQEAPVIMHEVERARQRLTEMIEPLRGQGMRIEVRVVTGTKFREISAMAHQANIDVVCCGTEGKSFVDYVFSGSVSEDLALRGETRTMTVRWDLLGTKEQAADAARNFAKRLVVPTDFSASALRAALSAYGRPAEALGTVYLLHVVSDESDEPEAQIKGLAAMGADIGCDIVTEIREGDPKDVVLDFLREVDATGVITGRTGRSKFARGLLGSTSMTLLQEAPCPVVIQP